MDTDQIINATIEHLKFTQKSINSMFYINCIEYLQKPKLKSSKISEISDRHIVEPLRMYIYNNYDDYVCLLVDFGSGSIDIIEEYVIYKKLKIYAQSENARSNMLRQLYSLESNDIDLIKTPLISLPPSYDMKNPIFIVTSIDHKTEVLDRLNKLNDIKYIHIENKRSINLFLCFHTCRFLKHQDLDRFCGYMKIADDQRNTEKNKKEIKKSVEMFKTVHKFYKNLELSDNDAYSRLMLFSGFVLHALGTTYTTDADTIFLTYGLKETRIREICRTLDKYQFMEYFMYDSQPHLENIESLITDPYNHFYFLGIKIINFNYHINRLQKRASPSAFVDMIMLKKINKLNTNPCIPLITVGSEHLIVYNPETIEHKLKTTQKYLKEWHNVSHTIEELKRLIPKCKEDSYDHPYRFKKQNIITRPITVTLRALLRDLISANFVRTTGSGDQENDQETFVVIDDCADYPNFYPRNKQKQVIVTEPSDNPKTEIYMELHQQETEKMIEKNKNNFIMLPVDYDGDWGNKIIDSLNGGDVDYVVIHYTLTRLLNSDNFIENLLKLCGPRSKLIIVRIDSDYVKSIFEDNESAEISVNYEYESEDDKKIISGIYNYDNDCVFYLKDTARYNTGRIETLTDPINILEEAGFKREKSQNMYDHYLEHYNIDVKIEDQTNVDQIKKNAELYTLNKNIRLYEKEITKINNYHIKNDNIMEEILANCKTFVLQMFKYDVYDRV